MGLQVTLAGQDISDLVHEETIQIISVLGQGPGAGSEGAGESTTCEVVADLSPGLAKGAGQSRDQTYLETVQADTPAGLWRMNSESEVRDISGNGNHGTVQGSGALSLTPGATGDANPGWLTDGVTYVRHPLDAIGNPKNLLTYQGSSFEANVFTDPPFKFGFHSAGVQDTTAGTFVHGSHSMKWTTVGDGTFESFSTDVPSSRFVAGATYTISFYAMTASGTASIRWFAEGNDNIPGNHAISSVTTSTFTTTRTRYSISFTMPNPIVDSIIGIRLDTGGTLQAVTIYLDGFQIEAGGTATPFVPGGAVGVTQEALVFIEDGAGASGPIKYTGTYATDGFGFGIGNGSDWNTPGVKLIGRTADNGWVIPSSDVILPVGEWVHVVAEWGSDGILTFYVNSVAQAGTALYGAAPPTGFGYIGGASNGDVASGMLIDEVATYSSVLDSSRIAAHYGAIGVVPVLVRQGTFIITDANGVDIFGGKATYFEDASLQQSLTVRTKISCHDYFQALDRVEVNEVYTGHDDVFIIKDILTAYAPWIDQSELPAAGTFTFGKRYVRAQSVKVALQKIAAVTGYLVWISPDAKIHYTAPTDASQAPFGLSDDPDFASTYGYDLASWSLDENAIINRVYFYGGKQESDDFTQDLFPQYNGTTNKVFLLAYYPHNATDGNIHVTKNGSDLVIGNPFSTGSDGKLIADGGTAQVLLNYDAETLTFDVSVLSGVTTLTATYRYNTPLVVVVSDKSSFQFYGEWYDGKLDDQNVLDATTAIQRARVLLAQQAFGLESLQIVTWQGGLMAGQIVSYVNSLRSVNTTYQVQRVQVDPLGAGHFQYTVDLGAWNWGLTDLVMATARRAGVQDSDTDENTSVITATELAESLTVQDTWTLTGHTTGAYKYRNVATDADDAHWGLFTWGP